jgi:hypothetical protein
MRRFIVFAVVLLILSSCVDREKVQLQKDLAASQAMVVYLTCLSEHDQVFCNSWLCERYPDAVLCEE